LFDGFEKLSGSVTSAYPDLAKPLRISGVVKLRATVAPNGSVKLIKPVGGNPVLIKAVVWWAGPVIKTSIAGPSSGKTK